MADVLLDELLVFSDHHAHPFTFGAKEVAYRGTFINSRLLNSVKVIEQMGHYADANGIKTVVFGGDLFHVREAVPTDALSFTADAISDLVKNREVILMSGNHDLYDRAGYVSSLDMFRYWDSNVWVASAGGAWHKKAKTGDDYTLHFVPYTDDRRKATRQLIQAGADTDKDMPAILFAHLGMQGAKVGSDFVLVSDQDITVDDVPYDKFIGCFFGHYHQHQQLFQNGWYIGASHHHNWGDVNTCRGFLHVRIYIDHVEFDFIESDAPRFISFREDSPVTVRPQDFVRVLTERKMTVKQTNRLREGLGNENCEVIYLPPEVKLSAIELSEENLSPAAMLDAWVKANADWLKQNLPDIASDDLVSYGKSILATVSEKT